MVACPSYRVTVRTASSAVEEAAELINMHARIKPTTRIDWGTIPPRASLCDVVRNVG
jgi:hypothetical protein